MSLAERAYEAGIAASRPALRVAALVNARAAGAVGGRESSLRRFEAWGAAERDPARPTVWIHAPSVGESLMAQAIIAALRERVDGVQVAFTYFSPSTERMAGSVGADVAGYIPWDTRGPVRRMLRAVAPRVVAYVRTEVWPVVSREARRAGARQLLVNAVLAETSSRLSWMGRSMLETVYRRLDAVGAVSDSHADRYTLLGVPPGAIHVTGDARFDQAWERVERRRARAVRADPSAVERLPDEIRPMFRVLHDPSRYTLVAGSTWPSDEKTLAPVMGVLKRELPIRLVIAPHEPTQPHLASLERRLDQQGVRHTRLGALLAAGAAAPDAVLVDRLGVLADLYALATTAYVGGGFRSAGLHSVVEPAALGVPVLFGPGHQNAREAGELLAVGGGFVVEGPGDIERHIRAMRRDPAALGAAGRAAESYVRAELGAAARNADLIAEHL